MKVSQRMSAEVITVSPDTPLREAQALLQRGGLRLPAGGVRRAIAGAAALGRFPAARRRANHPGARTDMAQPTITVAPGTRIEQGAQLMLTPQVHGLPVVSGEGKLLGVLTVGDLLRVMVKLPPADLSQCADHRASDFFYCRGADRHCPDHARQRQCRPGRAR